MKSMVYSEDNYSEVIARNHKAPVVVWRMKQTSFLQTFNRNLIRFGSAPEGCISKFVPCFLSAATSNKEAVKTDKEMSVREERCPNRKD